MNKIDFYFLLRVWLRLFKIEIKVKANQVTNMTEFTLTTKDGPISASGRFINACDTFKCMFEDLGSEDSSEPIPVTDQFSKEDITQYISLFDELDSLKVDFNGGNMSYLDYITEHQDHYISNYTNLNKDPPHCEKLASYLTTLGDEKITSALQLDTYFNNLKFRRGIMLIIAAFVRCGPEEEVDQIISSIMDIVQDNNN